jgi:CheY-like chemotaxis protein
LAKEKKKNEWRKPIVFPDGTKDCILLDEYSEIPKTEIVLLKDFGSDLVEEYSARVDAKILIVDDDFRRSQFFSQKFKNNKLDFASNADKAINYLTDNIYDLVCLDYDLGLGQKGLDLVKHINDKDIDVLVQSMNKEGVELITKELTNIRKLEVVPFESLVKSFGDTDA